MPLRLRVTNNFNEAIRANRVVRERILTSIGMYIQGGAKTRCPVDRGHLKGSIDYKVTENSVHIGSNKEYALPVHEGHRSYAGVPFLSDSAYQGVRQIETITRHELRREFG